MKSSLPFFLLIAGACGSCLGDSITSVSPISTQQIQTIVISGSGFGTHTPYTGNSVDLNFADLTKVWAAGCLGPGVDCAVNLIVDSWADSKIVLRGFAGAWGAPNSSNPGTTWTLSAGDKVQINVFNPQTGIAAGSITTTVGGTAAVPEPNSLALVLGAFALLAVSRLQHKQKRQLRLN